MKNLKLLVIVGETASGKSDLALALAQQFNGEIITADSWTVRKGMDIGTAKPSRSAQQAIPHHGLDIVSPCAPFTAAIFKDLANNAITEIASRGKLPIIVGGTGLYIDGVLFDYTFLDEGDPEARKYFNSLSLAQLLELIEAKKLDLTTIDIRNKRRLIRLLETNGQIPQKSNIRPNTLIIGVKKSRSALRKNIEQRVTKMLRAGLKHEVLRLVEKYGWECEGLKGIGYREWQDYFAGNRSLAETKRKIIKSTLELAKRQRTWFKRNPHIQWISSTEEAKKIAQLFLVDQV